MIPTNPTRFGLLKDLRLRFYLPLPLRSVYYFILLVCIVAPGCTTTLVSSLPATPALQVTKAKWTAVQASHALEQLQEYSPDLIVAPLKDQQYSVLTDASVHRFVAEYWKPIAEQMRKELPDTSATNCNNYSNALRLMANFAAMRSAIDEPLVGDAIVFHEHAFGGLPPTHENHDVVLFYTESGWWVAEAQSGFLAPIASYPNKKRLIFVSLH